MRFVAAFGLSLAASLALASCAGSGGPRRTLDPVANPSEVVAVELAFARAAREDGQWTAFRKFAADGALIFGRGGAFEAKPWLAKQQNPPQSVSWQPLAVWSSCDGSLAVTQFSFTDPHDGTTGLGHTVWQRQRGGEYRWVFDFGWPTGETTPEPDMISAKVAECGPGAAVLADAGEMRRSADGTLGWSFAFTGEGTRNFTVWTAQQGGMMTRVIDVSIPPAPQP
ncbi:hypothetical protein [Allopontixanthobacter sp.]|uniref:hypothetical protein n=1 Tax=Allopontixanthobacter sp. TaxID=2906452 RepID=UPI002ABCC244|nr:hypothetical protein [Allopontixanthobacter sp.]MDZ4307257.1 hypothetical protein [Allopontixanthobacter sp.]